jgi:hypothetical protein
VRSAVKAAASLAAAAAAVAEGEVPGRRHPDGCNILRKFSHLKKPLSSSTLYCNHIILHVVVRNIESNVAISVYHPSIV